MSNFRDALTILLGLALAVSAGYGVTKITFDQNQPSVYSFNAENDGVNNLKTYYTIPSDTECSENFDVNGRPEVNIGTYNPASDTLLLNTYPGEELQFCSKDNTTSETFQLEETEEGIVVEPEWIETGEGEVKLTHQEIDGELKNATRGN